MENSEMSASKRKLIFINIVVACIASSMMSTALSTGLPSIMSDLDISASLAQWLSSGYMLCMAIMMPATAFLVKRFRTRVLFTGVVAVYLAGLVIDILAMDFYTLMFGRILQACSNGVLMAMGQIILMTIYPVANHGSVLGWYGLSLTVAPIIAPAVSGVMIDAFTWRGVFIIPLVFMSLSLVASVSTMPDILETARSRFDVPSFALCALGFGGLTLGVGNMVSMGFASPATLVPLVLGVVGAVLFVRRQSSLEAPFLNLAVFRHGRFVLAVVVGMLFYGVILSLSVLMPMYFQNGMGYSAAMSGVFLIFGSLLVAVTSPMAGRWYDRRGIRSLVLLSAGALAVGCLGLSFLTAEMVLAAVVLYTVAALGGCQMMPMTAWGINAVPNELKADATSLINSLRTLGGALGMALSTGLMEVVSSGITGTPSECVMGGMSVTFMVLAVVSALIFVLGFLLRDASKASGTP